MLKIPKASYDNLYKKCRFAATKKNKTNHFYEIQTPDF